METVFTIIFVGVLLSIPLLLGRSFYRALSKRKRLAGEVPHLRHTSARIIGFTKIKDVSESSFREHYPIVEYQTDENEVIWAEAQPCKEGMFGLNTFVEILCRPDRPCSVRVVQSPDQMRVFVAIEKNVEIALSLLGICLLIAVAIWFHGLALHILGPVFILLVSGYVLGHLTKRAFWKREDRREELQYQNLCDRLAAAKNNGSVSAELTE